MIVPQDREAALEDEMLMARAAWLYYVGGLNQEATARRLGITRARVNKLLQDARETGLVSITINRTNVGLLPVEEEIRNKFGLDFCICTPALGSDRKGDEASEVLQGFAFRAVGAAAAAHLRTHLAEKEDAVIGTGWGRTLQQMTLQLAGVKAPRARFISVMGSLTANSAYNPFEVVHAFARSTGGEGFVLPVPFIADSVEDRKVLLSQRSVQRALEIGRSASVAYISIGELTEESLLRRQKMLTAAELVELRAAGAVGDTNGIFFDDDGRPVDHPLNHRTLALGLDELRKANAVGLIAGRSKVRAAHAFLKSGTAKGLIIDGDTALLLMKQI
jgi:DNA-binding transcriptional regulator LsrR (DeoR family)